MTSRSGAQGCSAGAGGGGTATPLLACPAVASGTVTSASHRALSYPPCRCSHHPPGVLLVGFGFNSHFQALFEQLLRKEACSNIVHLQLTPEGGLPSRPQPGLRRCSPASLRPLLAVVAPLPGSSARGVCGLIPSSLAARAARVAGRGEKPSLPDRRLPFPCQSDHSGDILHVPF